MTKNKLISALILSVLLLFQFCEKNNIDDSSAVTEFSNSVSDVNLTLNNFILEAQKFETTNLATLQIGDVKPFMDNYLNAAENYLEALNIVVEIQQNKSTTSFKKLGNGPDCSTVDFIPTLDNGVGPGLVKSVGDLINETKGEVDAIQQQWENGEIDDGLYYAAMNKLKISKSTKAFNLGLGSIAGTGAAIFTGAVVGTATLPAIATIAVVGGAVGVTTTWWANWYTGTNKDGDGEHFMLTGKTEVGGTIPIGMFGDNPDFIILVDGNAPVVVGDFHLPYLCCDAGALIEIDVVELADAKPSGSTDVCFSEHEIIASSCTEVQFVTASPYPVDPGPGEGVTITATLVPKVEGCDISFSIVGTDEYTDSATSVSDANGQATFFIPGGEEGIVDIVTITSSNGKTYTVTYVF